MNQARGALTVLETCMGLRRGDSLLVVYGPWHRGQAQRFKSAAAALGVAFASIEDTSPTGNPPSKVSGVVLESRVTVFCVDEEKTLLYGHSDMRAQSCHRGWRIGFLTQSLNSVPEKDELVAMRERTERMAALLHASREASIISGRGKCELDAKIGRSAIRLSSLISEPGSWGAVPDYAEVAVAPFERESNGELSIDGTVVGMGRVLDPVVLRFDRGKLVSATGGKLAEQLMSRTQADEGASTLCELGFGANHLRKSLRGEFDDKKMLGSIHAGLGDNHTIGGTNRSGVHFDCLMRSAQLRLDGRKVDLASV